MVGLKTHLILFFLQLFIIIQKFKLTQKVKIKIIDQDIYIIFPLSNLQTIIE